MIEIYDMRALIAKLANSVFYSGYGSDINELSNRLKPYGISFLERDEDIVRFICINDKSKFYRKVVRLTFK